MREILFRGKRIDNGELVKGFYVVLGGENHCIFTGRLDITKRSIGYEYFKVDPGTIGQFTGLTDKNGVKIFEGDIIEGKCSKNRKQRFRVWWHTSLCCFIAGELGQTRPGFNPGTMVNYEVIGNVYDNPELLEENKI